MVGVVDKYFGFVLGLYWFFWNWSSKKWGGQLRSWIFPLFFFTPRFFLHSNSPPIVFLKLLIKKAEEKVESGVGGEESVVGGDRKKLFTEKWKLIWVYMFSSLPKTTRVFEIDKATRIDIKQVCKPDVFNSSEEISTLWTLWDFSAQ